MIVISGALVLVALVLLVIGLVTTSLPFVYASIAVSVVSFVFLIIGILQRRGEQLPDAVPAGEETAPAEAADSGDREAVTAIGSVVRSDRRTTEPAAAGRADVPVSGLVLVVAGRPRYHVEGCRYLNGKDPDEVPVNDARDEGFTACGVCKPDEVLAEEAAAQPHPQPDEPAADMSAAASEGAVAAVPAPSSRSRTTKAPAKRAATAAPTKAPAKKAASKAAPAKAPSKAAVAAAASTRAAASAAKKPGSVVVIPDRGKFHTPVCRFVRDSADAQELSRAQATRQGYAACGVCKP